MLRGHQKSRRQFSQHMLRMHANKHSSQLYRLLQGHLLIERGSGNSGNGKWEWK